MGSNILDSYITFRSIHFCTVKIFLANFFFATMMFNSETLFSSSVSNSVPLSLSLSAYLLLVEPPSVAVYPSSLPLSVPGQVVTVHCEASGFFPLSLDLDWEFTDAEGKKLSLGQGSVTGHRQAKDGTFSQSSRLELDSFKLGLGRGGEVSCIAKHKGGSRRATVTLNVIGESHTLDITALLAVVASIS